MLSALPDLSPQWRRTVGPASPAERCCDVPHVSHNPPPNRAQTVGVWRQGVRSFRDFPTPEPHSGLLVVSPGDPKNFGSLAFRWRTAQWAAFRSWNKTRPTPGLLRVTSDRAGPAACPGPARHRPARGFSIKFSLSMDREGNAYRAKGMPAPLGTISTLYGLQILAQGKASSTSRHPGFRAAHPFPNPQPPQNLMPNARPFPKPTNTYFQNPSPQTGATSKVPPHAPTMRPPAAETLFPLPGKQK